MSLRVTTASLYQQGVAAMQKQTQALSKIQSQMASNLRYSRAGEDPVAAGRALNVDKALADTAQWTSNIGSAQDRLNMEEASLSTVSASLARIRELAVQANSGALSDTDRKSIADEMKQRLQEVMDQANSRDGQGGYLFAGSRTQSRPFENVGGTVGYQGDSMVPELNIGSNRQIAMGDAGDEVFMNVGSGDGHLDVGASSSNKGTAIVQSLSFTDASQWDGGSYRLQFSGGNYSVLDADDNTVGSGTYAEQQAIQFRGVSLTLTGTPRDGDSFTVAASHQQDMFTTVQDMIATVSRYGRSAATTAQDQTGVYNAMQSLDTLIGHISDIRGGVGARLNALDDASSQLDSRTIQLKETLSGLREIDYTEAAATLSQTTTTLQAAQQSYMKIQGLSLFDYLR
jgi:flagellar hook-associated protein 3 FlgL